VVRDVGLLGDVAILPRHDGSVPAPGKPVVSKGVDGRVVLNLRADAKPG